jgi:hypothetical protein
VALDHMFRTDRDDDESDNGDREWARGRVAGNRDPKGDDDVQITISDTGAIDVRYFPQ